MAHLSTYFSLEDLAGNHDVKRLKRELDSLRAAQFTFVSLGARVLRCETAATLCLGLHWWASHLADPAE